MWLLPGFVGLVLLLCALFLFPLLGVLFSKEQNKREEQSDARGSLDILIPCHNEQGKLRETLESINQSRALASSVFSDGCYNVVVGLDSCSDETSKEAEQFGAKTHNYSFHSKWKVLCRLVEQSTAEWVAFVDAGTVWDKRLLRNVIPFMIPSVSCIAPSYRIKNAGVLSRIFWRLESFLKNIENLNGGPVSVHGATIFYQRESLRHVLRSIAGRVWWTDDVVVPLMLRALIPSQQIIYASNSEGGFCVFDSAPRAKKIEHNARRRVAMGNLQWVLRLLPLIFLLKPQVFIVSLRRFFRLYWCVTAICVVLSAALFIAESFPFALWLNLLMSFTFLSLASVVLIRSAAFRASLFVLKETLSRRGFLEETIQWN